MYERLPAAIQKERNGDSTSGHRARVNAIHRFCSGVLEVVAPHVPCVKIQAACFERYHFLGVEALTSLIAEARSLGLVVILDAKRGDIGISAEHYAAGCLADQMVADLGDLPGPDALTINPYMGIDTIEPFVKAAVKGGKGLFTLVRTSNPGSDGIQNLELSHGGTVAQAMAGLVAKAGDGEGCVGAQGYSLLGAVVGATKPADAAKLRELMPRQIFLVPGFGAQGGGADDVRACFNKDAGGGRGAIITASRSILYAYEKTTDVRWERAIEEATMQMKRDIAAVLV